MRRKVSFGPEAGLEVREAAEFYGLESAGLQTRFVAELRKALVRLEEHPESGPVLRGEFRSILLRGFPYSLIYGIRGAEVRIFAVMHLRRRPFYWTGRKG